LFYHTFLTEQTSLHRTMFISGEDALPVGAIVGASVGGVAVLLCLILFIMCIRYEPDCFYYASEGWHIVIDLSVRPSVCPSLFCPDHNFITMKASLLNFICRYISFRRSTVHKNHNSKLIIWSYSPLFICILEFCPEHNSKSIQATDLKFHRQIDLIEEKCSSY